MGPHIFGPSHSAEIFSKIQDHPLNQQLQERVQNDDRFRHNYGGSLAQKGDFAVLLVASADVSSAIFVGDELVLCIVYMLMY